MGDQRNDGLFGAEDAPMAMSWLGALLSCASVAEVERFRESRFFQDEEDDLEALLYLKLLLSDLYEIACDPSEDGWRRVKLARSAVRGTARQEIESVLEEQGKPRRPAASGVETRPEREAGGAVPSPPPEIRAQPPARPFGVPSSGASSSSPWVAGAVLATPQPAAPEPPRAVSSHLPMSVERYAALVARTEGLDPAMAPGVHAEFGVTDEQHRRGIDSAFRHAFVGAPALARSYDEHLHRSRLWQQSQLARPTAPEDAAPPSSTSSVDSTAFMTPIADHADIHRPYFLLNFLHTLTPWARTPGAEIPVGFYGMYEHDRFFAGAERSDHAVHLGVRLSFPSQSEGRVLRRDM